MYVFQENFDGFTISKKRWSGERRFVRGKNYTFYPETGEIRYFRETSVAQKKRNKIRRHRNYLNKIHANFKLGNIFVTLTFAQPTTDLKFVKRKLSNFLRKFPYKYFYMIEKHKSGAYHIHILFKTTKFIKNSFISELWGLGFTKVIRLRKTINYIAKYLNKSESLFHCRFSNGLKEPEKYDLPVYSREDLLLFVEKMRARKYSLKRWLKVYKDDMLVTESLEFKEYSCETFVQVVNLNEFDDLFEPRIIFL